MTVRRRISGEMRGKIAIADASLDACASFLNDSDVARVGGKLAREALSVMDLLYVPNRRYGVYDMTGYDEEDERIPFIIANPGETVRIARHPEKSVHPRQWDSIRSNVARIDIDEMTDESFELIKKWVAEMCQEQNGKIVKIEMNLNSYAFVFAESSALGISRSVDGEPKTYGIETRPIVIGHAEYLQRPESGSNLYHELIHVIQFFRGKNSVFAPGGIRTHVLRRLELEAYSNQAVTEEAYYGVAAEENPYGWNSMTIEAIRRMVGDPRDPYRPTNRLMALLDNHGIHLEDQKATD